MQQNISILGCGWLGLPLAAYFVKEGWQVAGSTTSPEKLDLLSQQGITPFLIDLKTVGLEAKNSAFFQNEILIINIPPRKNAAIPYSEKIRKLAQVLKDTEVKKILFVSSTGIYAPSFSEINESAKLNEADSSELLTAEKIIAAPENPWQATIIRFAGLFGPNREPGRFMAGKSNLPDAEAPVNLIHLEDCIKLISEIIRQEKWQKTYNACADLHPSRKEFYTAATRKLNLPEPTFLPAATENKPHKLISNAFIKADLSYQFLYPDPLKAI